MAEFVEVMRQAHRMCSMQEKCEECPVWDLKKSFCRIGSVILSDHCEVERNVLSWAAAHPEPVYPSWKDAWNKLFPNASEVPCPRKYFDEGCFPVFICAEHDCDRCKVLPMHPEIAEKLGIKPKEE